MDILPAGIQLDPFKNIAFEFTVKQNVRPTKKGIKLYYNKVMFYFTTLQKGVSS